MNNYEMEIGKDELLGILNNYYLRKFNKKVNVKVEIEKEYDYYEDEYFVAKLYYNDSIELLGHKATRKVNISDAEIIDALNELLIHENYEVDYIVRNLEEKTVGKYKDEHTESVFAGIKLSIRKKHILVKK